MARTYSSMMPLGTPAPDFTLPNTVDGEPVSLGDIVGSNGTLIMFICNHCPFVKHIQTALMQINTFLDRGLGVAAISANDVDNYPDDAPDKMRELAQALSLRYPYLYDAPQTAAKAYGAECTPDFFLFDADRKCVYRGRLDASSPGNSVPVTGDELFTAIEALLAGEAINSDQQPSLGCNIKWKTAGE